MTSGAERRADSTQPLYRPPTEVPRPAVLRRPAKFEVRVRVHVRACVRACARACVRACVRDAHL